MIWLIAKKDFLLNLLSTRLLIGFLLCIVVVPFTLVVGVDGYMNQVRIYNIDKKEAEKESENIKVYSYVRPTIIKEPIPLSIFSKGINDNMGTKLTICIGDYPLLFDGQTNTRDNPFLNAFFSIDFVSVIAILISLLALVFSYDTITRENEDSTMKLIFSGRISRITFIFGKLLGLVLTLLPILIFCYLLACLIIVINPEIHFSATDWGGIGLLFLTSTIYMMTFILLGMYISSLTHSSSNSIIISLLCWIIILFIIPSMSFYLSQSIVKTPTYNNIESAKKEFNKNFNDYASNFHKEYMAKNPHNQRNYYMKSQCINMDIMMEIYGGGRKMVEYYKQLFTYSIPIIINLSDKIWAVQKNYLDILQRQQQIQQYISWLSPSEIFKQTTQKLCSTDADSYLKYMENVRNYRKTLINYMKETKKFESLSYFTPAPLESFATEEELENMDMYYYSNEKWLPSSYPNLNLDDIPKYSSTHNTVSSAINAAMGRITALIGITTILLIGLIVAFNSYKIR